MRKIVLIMLTVFTLGSCTVLMDNMDRDSLNTSTERAQENHTTVMIEGCEYLFMLVKGGYTAVTHKGNCSNPIHVYNKKEVP